VRDHVTQAVVPGVAAALLQPSDARREVQLVVGHENFARVQLVETRNAADGPSTQIHEGRRLREPYILRADAHAGELGLVARLEAEDPAITPRELVGKPEACIVPRACIPVAGVAEADDEL